jgi:hypothetical protein
MGKLDGQERDRQRHLVSVCGASEIASCHAALGRGATGIWFRLLPAGRSATLQQSSAATHHKRTCDRVTAPGVQQLPGRSRLQRHHRLRASVRGLWQPVQGHLLHDRHQGRR